MKFSIATLFALISGITAMPRAPVDSVEIAAREPQELCIPPQYYSCPSGSDSCGCHWHEEFWGHATALNGRSFGWAASLTE
ncbi:hypothetical protein N0V88_006718 [Collariella sp. IMI 366227]|nr:hypothetical protein N0V88_006718 [Collariella sp. IMI 366227]